MKTEFLLVDFENVQPKDATPLKPGNYKVKVFMGKSQTRIPLDVVRAFQAFGPDVEYLPIEGSGKNALDFHIAYYIGRLAVESPGCSLHIISKDTGFDPLVRHVNSQGIPCRRSKSLAEAISAKPSEPEQETDRVAAVLENLAKRKAAKPRTLKTLRSTINALFGKQLGAEAVDTIVEEMVRRGCISLLNGKVTYVV